MDSNIDTDENMDIITKSGNPIVEIRKIEIRKNEQQTSQDNSNELNLEEIETDSAKKGKMLSGGGGINKNLGGKKVSRKHAIPFKDMQSYSKSYSMKGKKKKKEDGNNIDTLKLLKLLKAYQKPSVSRKHAILMYSMKGKKKQKEDGKNIDTFKAYQKPSTTTTTRSTTLDAVAKFSQAEFHLRTSTFDTSSKTFQPTTSTQLTTSYNQQPSPSTRYKYTMGQGWKSQAPEFFNFWLRFGLVP